MLDYPCIRRSVVCPLCSGPKAASGIACWPCYRSHGLRDHTSPEVEAKLDLRETLLEYDYGRNFD